MRVKGILHSLDMSIITYSPYSKESWFLFAGWFSKKKYCLIRSTSKSTHLHSHLHWCKTFIYIFKTCLSCSVCTNLNTIKMLCVFWSIRKRKLTQTWLLKYALRFFIGNPGRNLADISAGNRRSRIYVKWASNSSRNCLIINIAHCSCIRNKNKSSSLIFFLSQFSCMPIDV